MHLKDLRLDLKMVLLLLKIYLAQPEEVKILIYKMDKLLKIIES